MLATQGNASCCEPAVSHVIRCRVLRTLAPRFIKKASKRMNSAEFCNILHGYNTADRGLSQMLLVYGTKSNAGNAAALATWKLKNSLPGRRTAQ
jgi:hypothetical protein